ncbi:MAG TPA: ExeM/NucH family extracellular endonuclease [Nocardioides sp.]|nr:ExeM/NucH family extracellular endonuclease [Nocardioides sp.]
MTLGVALVPMTAVGSTAATASELFFSEYVEGSGYNKAIEIYNGTGAPVDLATSGYVLELYSNGAAAPSQRMSLEGQVADGDVVVLAHPQAGPAVQAVADGVNGSVINWNGDDALVLRRGGAVVDSIGQVGTDPGAQWGVDPAGTENNTLRRKAGVTGGDPNPADAFDPAAQWDGYPADSFDGLGVHAGGPGGGEPEPEPTGPTADCDDDVTTIPAIQGTGGTSPLAGTTVATEGVVVADHEGRSPALGGFFLQDPAGDGDPATSDGLWVFNSSADEVDNGDHVRVLGTVSERGGQTEIGADRDGVVVCAASDGAQPPVAPAPAAVTLPFTDAAAAERHEGMLVTFPQELSVTETFGLGRYGEVRLSSGGRLPQPTNVAEPGPAALQVQAANDLNQIVVDDGTDVQNQPIAFGRGGAPLSAENTLRGGDTTTGMVGVLSYKFGAYRVRPTHAVGGRTDFQPANPRTAAPDAVGGGVQVASFNVLNYFNTFTGCRGGVAGDPLDCRGADDAFEQERQAAKIVAALAGLDADVVGLVEIENDGYGPDSALADLTRRLNEKVGAGTYTYLDVDTRNGHVDALGDDAIKVAMIYKPAVVNPNGRTAVLNTDSFVNGESGEPRNRPALAQTFLDKSGGGRFTLAVNHLKSKGSSCNVDGDPDTGDLQGSCNRTRTESARELADWLAAYPTGVKDPDTLVMGDLNAYAQEDPVDALREKGYTDLVQRFEAVTGNPYSYVYDGQWGYLDHALATGSLAPQVVGTTTWHINADEPPVLDYDTAFKSPQQVADLYAPTPYRSSDHDPVLVGLRLTS